MKLKDVGWISVLIVISLFVFLPQTNKIFVRYTSDYPYIMGFLKTMILASMGEILVKRVRTGFYFSDKGFLLKAIVWGFLGMAFVFVFPLFDNGVKSIFNNQTFFEQTFLNRLMYAFLISTTMNLIFAPTFMMLHRITDTYINLAEGSIKKIIKIDLYNVIDHIDFKFFYGFVILKTIPFFWIPAHTITFMLPDAYRVLMASYLSIVLGMLLTLKKQ